MSSTATRPGDGHATITAVDGFDTATFLQSVNQADGDFVERFILPAGSLTLAGAPVAAPWLDHVGLYLTIDASGGFAAGRTSFDSLTVTLWADPGKDDGAAGAGLGGVGFARGTTGDIALATGTLVSAVLSQDAELTRHADFVETLTATQAGRALFGHSLDGLTIAEHLTTPAGVRSALAVPTDGSTVNLVNGGTAEVELSGIAVLPITPQSLRHAVQARLADELAAWGHGHHGAAPDDPWG
jgi:hypothetical protein